MEIKNKMSIITVKTPNNLELKGVSLGTIKEEYNPNNNNEITTIELAYCQNRLFFYNSHIIKSEDNPIEEHSIDVITDYIVIPKLDELLKE